MKPMLLNTLLKSALLLAALAATAQAAAGNNEPAQKQDLAAVRQKVEEFLAQQAVGYPGQVSVSAGAIDRNLRLAACPAMEVFLPPGSRAWGKTSVGVRCVSSAAWTIYIQATVSVMTNYLVAGAPLAQGRIVSSQDLVFEKGDLTKLPPGIFTDPEQAIGRTVGISLTAGTVLRQEMLKQPPAVQQGQKVLVSSSGKGFRVSAEGQALASASEGQVVQVKVASGEVISGIARAGGQIEVSF